MNWNLVYNINAISNERRKSELSMALEQFGKINIDIYFIL